MGLVVLTLLAAVPSQTDFSGTYFHTNTLPISLVGNLTNWSKLSTNAAGGDLVWLAYTNGPDIEGGTVYGATTTNSFLPGVIDFAANYLPITEGGDFTVAVSIGYPNFNPRQTALANTFTFAVGGWNLSSATLTNDADDTFAYGYSNFSSSIIDGGGEHHAYGTAQFSNANLVNNHTSYGLGRANFGNAYMERNSYLFANGESCFQASTLLTNQDLYAWGRAFQGAVMTNCSDIFGAGADVGANLVLNGKSHIFIAGSRGQATNSNDYVFGDNAYNYFFPGASARFDSLVTGVSGFSTPSTNSASEVVATNGITLGGVRQTSWAVNSTNLPTVGTAGTYGDGTHTLSPTIDAYGRVTGITSNTIAPVQILLTHEGTVTLDLSALRSEADLTLTGAVTLAASSLSPGHSYTLFLYNTLSTNCAFTFPAGWTNWIGGAPVSVTANSVGVLSVSSRTTNNIQFTSYAGQ